MTNNYLIYIGKNTASLPNVPARNLSYEEAQQHDITKLLQSGLYIFNYEAHIADEIKNDLKVKEEPAKKKTRRVKNG